MLSDKCLKGEELIFFCRLCLQRDRELVDIYEDDKFFNSAEMALAQKISACVSIEVSLFNREPRKICSECLNHLNAWYDFKMTCNAANNVLQEYLNNYQEEQTTAMSAANSITEDSLLYPETSFFSCDTLLEKSMSLQSNISSIVDYFFTSKEKNDECKTESVHYKSSDDFVQKTEQPDARVSALASGTNPPVAEIKKTKSKNEEKGYHCELCDRTFSHFSSLLSHDETIHSAEMKKYSCSTCERLFISGDRLNNHTKLNHRQKTHQCPICDKFYVSKKSLEVHSRLHTEKYKCEKCGFLSTSKLYLSQHMQKHDGVDVCFTCTICQQKFSQKSSLLRHNKLHSNNHGKPFKCSNCHLLFRSHSELESHKNTHNEEYTPKIFKCRICNDIFLSQKTLRAHQKKHQEARFRYHCDVCEKKFTSNYELRIHVDTHSDNKPFDCFHCNKKFSFRKSLIKHLRNFYPRVRSDLII